MECSVGGRGQQGDKADRHEQTDKTGAPPGRQTEAPDSVRRGGNPVGSFGTGGTPTGGQGGGSRRYTAGQMIGWVFHNDNHSFPTGVGVCAGMAVQRTAKAQHFPLDASGCSRFEP